jgi:hypothetical protein
MNLSRKVANDILPGPCEPHIPMPLRRFLAAALLLVVFAACTDGTDGAGPTGSSDAVSSTGPSSQPAVEAVQTPTASASPTRPPLPEEPPPTSGSAALDCVNGWTTPPRNDELFTSPLGVIRRTTGVRGPFEVVDLRYFEGPESPPSDKGYLLVVQRWYVKLFSRRDFAFAGRFLVEARRFGQGVAATAPYDSSGYRSPDWIGFQYDSADPERRTYEGLPGQWAGIPYDFVKGGAGLEIAGLPDDVVGCLSAT